METHNQEARRINLPQGKLLSLEDACGTEIRVEHGVLWITQDGDVADFVVQSGESIRLDRGGMAMLTACGSFAWTLVSIEPRRRVQAAGTLRRINWRAFASGASRLWSAWLNATAPRSLEGMHGMR